MKVPFNDLKAQYQSIKAEIDTAIENVIDRMAFVRGSYVENFEDEFARALGTVNCVSCANGTDAIYIALKALGIGLGDEVITTALSWISTSESISQTGARVVFADIEREYFTVDPTNIEEKITSRTRAIIPVHLYGQSADMDAIMALASKYGLAVIEDCAQAHLAKYKNKPVGTIGNAGTFSFYPGKNLGAFGDAGAIISNDNQFSVTARKFANHGSLVKHQHELEGVNSRLDGIQAAILSVKLKYLPEWNMRRTAHSYDYNKILEGIDGMESPVIRDHCDHVYHLYVIRSDRRDALRRHLNDVNISSGIHYPVALPFLDAYRYLGNGPSDFPVAYEYQSKILSLPMYPELTAAMIRFTGEQLKSFEE